MKSPWHFISRLTSRNGAPSPESAPSSVPETPAAGRSDEHSDDAEHATTSFTAPLADTVDSSAAAPDTLRVVVKMTEEESVDREPVAEEAVPVSPVTPAGPNGEPSAKVELRSQSLKAPSPRISLNGQRKAQTKQVQENVAPDPKETFVLDAVDLDDDIKQLRIDLAEKLETQNRQLRSMLSRFDR